MLKSVFILLMSKVLKNMRNSILSLLKTIDAPLVKYTKSYEESYCLPLLGWHLLGCNTDAATLWILGNDEPSV